ncbi:hypothetical protein DAPPUDRAFT_249504 [Daphnia pulex]|uniref:Uncharacterized protein n=1 Tax=Daphnia pulex TaxID=6669 RepID=E9GWS8_DAPPU|nr:hypothetical protein DAPPUDRAFT_249504 [Daphnia pulex]|eukprot:EFX75956.1 hypothetical protein DAPPUDRAFT_249504 [Daphnia pulex]
MLRQYSREELMSFNRPAPPSIPQSRFIFLRLSGLCLFRPTKRPKKRRPTIADGQTLSFVRPINRQQN